MVARGFNGTLILALMPRGVINKKRSPLPINYGNIIPRALILSLDFIPNYAEKHDKSNRPSHPPNHGNMVLRGLIGSLDWGL